MMVTMDIDACKELITLICNFTIIGKKCTLKEFQHIASHVNWALNVFPLLQPSLSAVYVKTAGKEYDFATIGINIAVTCELAWVVHRVEFSTSVHILKSVEWNPRCTDSGVTTFFMDALSIFLAFHILCAKLPTNALHPLLMHMHLYISFFLKHLWFAWHKG